MRVGIGLPSSVPGTSAEMLLSWARRAEECQTYGSLGVVDRVLWDCHEPMTVLAAVAAATTRVRLVTMVVIAPLRSTALLAKQAAGIDALSGGRFTLGVAVGAREEDYAAAGIDSRGRGRRLNGQLEEMRSLWEDPSFGPRPATEGGPELVVGGESDAALTRMARYAEGYVHGGGPPRQFARTAERVHTAWRAAGRPHRPRLWAQGYFALGDEETAERGRSYMRDYYAFTGPFAERIAQGLLTTPQSVVQFVNGYADAGCEDLVLLPAVCDLDQVDRLAGVLSGEPTQTAVEVAG